MITPIFLHCDFDPTLDEFMMKVFGFEFTDAACGFVEFTREQVLL